MFPDPGCDQRPVKGPGGSRYLSDDPKHHSLCALSKADLKSFKHTGPFGFCTKLQNDNSRH